MAKNKIYTQDDRMDFYKPHEKVKLEEGLLTRIRVREVGKFMEFSIWLVDGEVIRDEVDVDFTAGGNPGRYLYVPEGEIWVEETSTEKDYLASVVHEWYEAELMIKSGLSYSDAHDEAASVERDLRRDVSLKHKQILPLD